MRCHTCRKEIYLQNYRFFKYSWDGGSYEFYTCLGTCGDKFLSKYEGYHENFSNRKKFDKEKICWKEMVQSRFDILDL
jgi:hypothetical protein